jgi:threonine synthase
MAKRRSLFGRSKPHGLKHQRGSRQWRGVIHEYADRLDVSAATPVVTLGEGGTPLIEAHWL